MIDIKTDLPVREECFNAIQDRFAQIRDLMVECEQILHAACSDEVLMTADEVAEYFRTDKKHIPAGLPKVRRNRENLYSRADVVNYVKTKLRKY